MADLVLAPLLGITNHSFRRVIHELFPSWDRAMAPFVASNARRGSLSPSFKDIFRSNNLGSLPVEPQILGKNGEDFAHLAGILKDQEGYERVNWNIGCPSPTVTSRGRGAGMLPRADEVDRFLDTVHRTWSGTVTVKMRLGMDDEGDWEALVPVLARYPLGEVTVHPRTGRQQYEGRASVEAFHRFYERWTALSPVPLVYSGDVRSPGMARALVRSMPRLGGVMVGRWALVDPGFPGLARLAEGGEGAPGGLPDYAPLYQGPPLTPWKDRRRFHDRLLETWYQEARVHQSEAGAQAISLGRIKEVWHYWEAWFWTWEGDLPRDTHGGHAAVRPVLKARTWDEYHRRVEHLWEGL